MSKILEGCVPELVEKFERLLVQLKEGGIEMRPYFGLRSPAHQARLWRQSRTLRSIEIAAAEMRAEGASWLADVLIGVGPQYGREVTGALPGQSWHQWGEAVDCFWVRSPGSAEWRVDVPDVEPSGYREYRRLGIGVGFSIGPRWDWTHLQLRPDSAPRYTWSEIDYLMQEKWGP